MPLHIPYVVQTVAVSVAIILASFLFWRVSRKPRTRSCHHCPANPESFSQQQRPQQ